MRLSAFTVVDAYPERDGGDASRVREVLRLAEDAEAAGLSALWVAEHHFHAGGVCPSPPVLLAACGMRTRSLRLGALVSVLPFHRPIDIAEDYALVDQLTEGRLNLGVGSGYLASEFEGFGVDPSTRRARFDSALATVLTAFAGQPFRVGGEEAPLVRLNVLPAQQPYPPLWIAVQRREAIPFVARKGLSVALIPYATVNHRADLGEEVREYRAALPPGKHGEVAVAVHLYAGEHPALARAAFARYLESRRRAGSTHYEQKARAHPEHSTPEAIEANGLALFGSPEEVVRRLGEFEGLGVDELLGIFDFGGLPPEEVSASVRALGAAWQRATRAGSEGEGRPVLVTPSPTVRRVRRARAGAAGNGTTEPPRRARSRRANPL